VGSNEEAERIYAALAEGGEVFMKIGETFFAHRFGQVRDKFGINWMIVYEKAMG
jgi:PhnB protein